MKPSKIYYSQDSIRDKFENNYTLMATYNILTRHPGVMVRIPKIRVCFKNGKWYSLDNRRLWVFRRLEENGYISSIAVKRVAESELPENKFTTTNGGTSVEVRPTRDFTIDDLFDSDSDSF